MPVNTPFNLSDLRERLTVRLIDLEGNVASVSTADITVAQQAQFRDAIGAMSNAAVFQTIRTVETIAGSDPMIAQVFEDAHSTVNHVLTLVYQRYVANERQTTTVTIPAYDINLKVSPASSEVNVNEPRIVAFNALMADADWMLVRAYTSARKTARGETRIAPNRIEEPATGSVNEPPGMNPENP